MIPTLGRRGGAWRMFARAVATSAVLMLAGCGSADRGPPSGTERDPGQRAEQSAENAPVPASSVPAITSTSGRAAARADKNYEAVARAPVIDSNPRRLVGLDQSGLTALLGVPKFRRRDGPVIGSAAELWRYCTQACILDLFLYRPAAGAGAALTVHHYRARTSDNGTIAAAACLEALLRAPLPGKPG